jgi:hypothetical protein
MLINSLENSIQVLELLIMNLLREQTMEVPFEVLSFDKYPRKILNLLQNLFKAAI